MPTSNLFLSLSLRRGIDSVTDSPDTLRKKEKYLWVPPNCTYETVSCFSTSYGHLTIVATIGGLALLEGFSSSIGESKHHWGLVTMAEPHPPYCPAQFCCKYHHYSMHSTIPSLLFRPRLTLRPCQIPRLRRKAPQASVTARCS